MYETKNEKSLRFFISVEYECNHNSYFRRVLVYLGEMKLDEWMKEMNAMNPARLSYIFYLHGKLKIDVPI